jgi:ankyrin repeat protein
VLSLEVILRISDHLETRDIISLARCAKGFACFLATRIREHALRHTYDNGLSVFHWAAARDRVDMLQALCRPEIPLGLYQEDGDNNTSLAVAAAQGKENAVRYLLAKGADAAEWDRFHRTPLMKAAARPANTGVMHMLLDAGANPTEHDRIHRTALHEAARVGNESGVKLLIATGADISAPAIYPAFRQPYEKPDHRFWPEYDCYNIPEDWGEGWAIENECHHSPDEVEDLTPFDLAARHGHLAVVQIFLDSGYPLDRKTVQDRTALWFSCVADNTAMVKLLLKAGLEPNGYDSYDDTLLHHAVREGGNAIARALVRAGGDLEATDSQGRRPIHIAVENGNTLMCRLLIESGADVVLADDPGGSLLDFALSISANMDMIIDLRLWEKEAR